MGKSPQRALSSVLAIVAAVALCAGCEVVDIDNAQPRLTWVAVAPVEADVVQIHVWISDYEGDPVDLDVAWQVSGSPEAIVVAPGGHGIVGLTTDQAIFDPNGQSHAIYWDTVGVPASGLQLSFVLNDRKAGKAKAVVTPVFDLSVGVPEPVQPTEP